MEPQVRVHELPLILSSLLEWNTEPAEILGIQKSAENHQPEVLVKWVGLLDFECTWEPIARLAEQFPQFQLEDEICLLRGGIDKLAVPLAFIQRKQRSRKRVKVAEVKSEVRRKKF